MLKGWYCDAIANIRCDYRRWVRIRSQDYVLTYFDQLVERRKANHKLTLQNIEGKHKFTPLNTRTALANADIALKRGISDDWKMAVRKYPEVLDYFHMRINSGLDQTIYQSPVISWDANKGRNVIIAGPLREL
jgi:hypothetical protein